MAQCCMVFAAILSPYPLLRGMLSQILVGGYAKLLPINPAKSALLGGIRVEDGAVLFIG